ncbi:hypothetical protein E4633_12555 [Geomonas terrae]|uniref:Uncharacterized protein n=1 Tax=Geomonas terrae TaxID=2562681 RepID=A0A4V3NZC3_9BACT|nr:hypothetical protein [Geomonas terrae]TGU71172.1 hypothetical protein E4633_12555 [Geomonas terrae]
MVQWKRLRQILTLDAWPAWLLTGGLCCAWLISYSTAKHLTDQVLYAGTFLQAIGLGAVALGIHDLQKAFGKPSLAAHMVNWLHNLKASLSKPVPVRGTLTAENMCVEVNIEGAALTSTSEATIEDRVKALEKALADLRKEHNEQVGEIRTNISRVEGLVSAESVDRKKGDVELLEKIEVVAVGGVRLEAIGVVWLFLGVLLTCIPRVIASFVPVQFSM